MPVKIAGQVNKSAFRSADNTREFAKAERSAQKAVLQLTRKTVDKRTGFDARDTRQKIKLKGSEVVAKGKQQNMFAFQARRSANGVTARPWRRRVIFRGAFIFNRRVLIRTKSWRNPKRQGKRSLHNEGVRPLWGPGMAPETRKAQRTSAFRRRVRSILRKAMEQSRP